MDVLPDFPWWGWAIVGFGLSMYPVLIVSYLLDRPRLMALERARADAGAGRDTE